MKWLLDTHTLLWVSTEPELLSRRAARALSEGGHDFFVSAISSFELATKHRLGKLPAALKLLDGFEDQVKEVGFHLLAITSLHGRTAGSYPHTHKDPFDRILAAQARIEGLILLSADTELDSFGVQRIW